MMLWFVIFLFSFYFMIFSYILPLIFSSLKVRSLFFDSLLKNMLGVLQHYYIYFSSLSKTVFFKFLLNFVKNNFVLKFNLLKNKSL